MATYKVGDRVRIARVAPGDCRVMVGAQATVASSRSLHACSDGVVRDTYILDIDGYAKGEWCAFEWQIEPTQPERNRVVAWEDVPGGRPKVEEFA